MTTGARDFILVETDDERHSLAGKRKNWGDLPLPMSGRRVRMSAPVGKIVAFIRHFVRIVYIVIWKYQCVEWVCTDAEHPKGWALPVTG